MLFSVVLRPVRAHVIEKQRICGDISSKRRVQIPPGHLQTKLARAINYKERSSFCVSLNPKSLICARMHQRLQGDFDED